MPDQDTRDTRESASRREYEREASDRAETLEEHLWCLAIAIGPDVVDRGMWQAADGTPVDVARHLSALADGIRELRFCLEDALSGSIACSSGPTGIVAACNMCGRAAKASDRDQARSSIVHQPHCPWRGLKDRAER